MPRHISKHEQYEREFQTEDAEELLALLAASGVAAGLSEIKINGQFELGITIPSTEFEKITNLIKGRQYKIDPLYEERNMND